MHVKIPAALLQTLVNLVLDATGLTQSTRFVNNLMADVQKSAVPLKEEGQPQNLGAMKKPIPAPANGKNQLPAATDNAENKKVEPVAAEKPPVEKPKA